MPGLTTYTKPLTAEQARKLRGLLQESGWEFQTKPYCLYAAAHGKVNVLVYEKGPKIVVQGKDTEEFVTNVLEPQVLGVAELGYEEVHHPEMFEPHIGVDESGKGDFFGPLVIAGVHVDREAVLALRAIGAVDSKKIGTDAKIAKLAEAIRQVPGLRWEVIQIGPAKYNELYQKFGNLNRLLAWGHAKVIETLLERVPECKKAISDQFANPAVLKRALQTRGRDIELIQRTKAESDPAVAAASILARDRFVQWLDQTSQRLQIELPKGVSAQVKANARALFKRDGLDGLAAAAKMHFKTAAEVTGAPLPPDGPTEDGIMR
ncbi:ribonuclease HIII [Brevifollis gellanilyticus]|uniref:Ribonuclease n=1 Tax=Brevifollis gellanilyticus TaxID=748831 RepID=A0A512MDR4_9BACT|nr:ribonuclease HIII [Brevifollis gellanilyticus]GEP44875.1 ribonuclease HIII [Brevifollis gellanilyticus]